jgi:Domain of unknown function (DUF4349)
MSAGGTPFLTKHAVVLAGLALLPFAPFGCGRKSAPAPGRSETVVAPAPLEQVQPLGYAAKQAAGASAADRSAPASGGGAPAAAPPSAGLAAQAASRKLIRTGQLTVEVAKYEAAAREVERIAEANGGYVADSQTARLGENQQRGTITIRVAADRFPAAVAALKALGKVRSESVATQDVTKAYADLETRLRVKRETEARIREILRSRTARLSDVLEAERELARIIGEIEQAEGERRFYDQQIALSTIAVTLGEPAAVIREGVFAPIGEALRESLGVLAQSLAALIYVLVLLVPWLLLAALVFWEVRALRARRKARATAEKPAPKPQ